MAELAEFPLLYAFTAGAVATINPCGFALLPAYISYHLGAAAQPFAAAPLPVRLARGVALGMVATAGCVALFASLGAVFSLGGRAIVGLVPWATLLVGAALIGLGLAVLAGHPLHVPALGRIRLPAAPGWRGVLLFGLGYGVASLSCTLPIFLVVVGSALTLAGLGAALLTFVAYALGMGTVLTALTVGTALFKGAVAQGLRRLVPYVERASALLLLGAGLSLVAYWAGPLLSRMG